MSWIVRLTNAAVKQSHLLPPNERRKMELLLNELRRIGPVRGNWPNYSKLADGSHHCHLSYRWVACWRETVKGIQVEVYYVGSREKAPY